MVSWATIPGCSPSVWTLISFPFFLKFYFLCKNVLPACMLIHHVCVWYPQRLKKRLSVPLERSDKWLGTIWDNHWAISPAPSSLFLSAKSFQAMHGQLCLPSSLWPQKDFALCLVSFVASTQICQASVQNKVWELSRDLWQQWRHKTEFRRNDLRNDPAWGGRQQAPVTEAQ